MDKIELTTDASSKTTAISQSARRSRRRCSARSSHTSDKASSNTSPSDQIESSEPKSAIGATCCCAISSSSDKDIQNADRRGSPVTVLIHIVVADRDLISPP